MEDARQVGKMLLPGAVHTLPMAHRELTVCHQGLCLLDLGTVCLGVVQRLQALLNLCKDLRGLPQTTENGKRIALSEVMAQMEQIRNAQAAQPCLGQLDQRLGPVTHQVQHPDAKRLEALVDTAIPGLIATIHRHRFHQHIATGKVHEHQHHALQKGLVHCPDDGSYLAMRNTFLFPRCGGLENDALQVVHDASQGAGRAPYMRLQAKAAKKLAECLGSHTTFETKYKQGGHDQADQPGAAGLRFPQRRLRVAISAVNRLEMTMHAAFGKPRSRRQVPHALLAVFTNRVENDNTLGPQSHRVGPCSEGWLTSRRKSALQSTRSTAICPALRGCPSHPHWLGTRRHAE